MDTDSRVVGGGGRKGECHNKLNEYGEVIVVIFILSGTHDENKD